MGALQREGSQRQGSCAGEKLRPRMALRGLLHLNRRPNQRYYAITNFLLRNFKCDCVVDCREDEGSVDALQAPPGGGGPPETPNPQRRKCPVRRPNACCRANRSKSARQGQILALAWAIFSTNVFELLLAWRRSFTFPPPALVTFKDSFFFFSLS